MLGVDALARALRLDVRDRGAHREEPRALHFGRALHNFHREEGFDGTHALGNPHVV
jgi:hypothetical protein